MKAVILAGGLGTRLHPLTQVLPKPMVPVAGRPWLDRLLEDLRAGGVEEVHLALRYRADVIRRHVGDGARYGLKVYYHVENEPLGTGGALAVFARRLDEPFLALNADVVLGVNPAVAWQAHVHRGAVVTLTVVEVEDPSPYGLVDHGADGRVWRFREKPAAGEADHRWVNAGLYVVDPRALRDVPEGEVSWEKQVVPELLARGEPVYALRHTGYWVDVGTPSRYLTLHEDVLARRAPLQFPWAEVATGIWQGEGVEVADGARLVPPVALGDRVRVESGAQVGPYAVVGNGATIGAGAVVQRSVLWDHARVGEGAELVGSVVGYRTAVQGTLHDTLVTGEAPVPARPAWESGLV